MNHRTNLCAALLVLVAAAVVCDYLTLTSLLHVTSLGSAAELRHWFAPGSWACFAAGTTLLAVAAFVRLVEPEGVTEI